MPRLGLDYHGVTALGRADHFAGIVSPGHRNVGVGIAWHIVEADQSPRRFLPGGERLFDDFVKFGPVARHRP